MDKRMTTMEGKIDEMKTHRYDTLESKLDNTLERMESAYITTEDKIDDQGLHLSSIKRAMERLHEKNKREEVTHGRVENKLYSYEVMLRRILGFHETMKEIYDYQRRMGEGVQDLLDVAFPPKDNDPSSEEEETKTQYDNDDDYQERLGTGPPPTLFPHSNPSFLPVASSSIPGASYFFPAHTVSTPTVPSPTVPLATDSGATGLASADSVPTDPAPAESAPTDEAPADSAATSTAPLELTRTVPAPTAPLSEVPDSSFVPVPSPDITMTTPTPLNSQDVDQGTTTIISSTSLLPLPTPSGNHLSPPPATVTGETNTKARQPPNRKPTVGGRRSPRIQENSRAPSPAVPSTGKRRKSEDDEEGGVPKRQRVAPS
jgi:hypothetical protein